MADVLIKSETMTAIADAIRNKTGKADPLLPSEMPGEIEEISAGDGRLPNYDGSTRVLPSFEKQTLGTKNKSMAEDVEILPIHVTEVSNTSGGKTISI